MTNKEAIYTLNITRILLKKAMLDGDEVMDRIDTVTELAIQALKKQEPKEPEVDCHIGDMECNSYDYYKCPECGTEVYRAYCPECGQGLDWSIDDEK